MSNQVSIQDAIIGEVLPNIGRRHAGMRSDPIEKAIMLRLGTRQQRASRAMAGNAQRVPQSVVKRVRNGGAHSPKELRRQLDYITRDEATKSTWLNFNGIERGLYKNSVETTVPLWTSSWAGNPKRGHSDHIILSFPKDTNVEAAENIAKEWGRAVFGSGDFGDQWRYVAALHANTDHVHAHFVVDKRGNDHGQFLSISMKSELNYDVMRELHAKIANEHGVALNASSRLSRGVVEYPPRETEYRAAHDNLKMTGEETPSVEAPKMSIVERMKREAMLRSFANQYQSLSSIARLTTVSEGQGGFMEKLSGMFSAASDILKEGGSLMTATDTQPPSIDPTERFSQDVERIFASARETWADIQEMEPGAERAHLEERFAEETRLMRDAAVSEPFMEHHARELSQDNDPYSLDIVRDIHSVRDHLGDDPAAHRTSEMAMDDLRQRLEAAFTVHEDRLERAGTNAEEMAERFMLSNRTAGQVEAWRAQGIGPEVDMDHSRTVLAELENGVGENFDSDSVYSKYETLIVSATALGTEHEGHETAGDYVDSLRDLMASESSMTNEERQYMAALPALMERDETGLRTSLDISRRNHLDLAQHEDGAMFDPEAAERQVDQLVDGQVSALDEITGQLPVSYDRLERDLSEEAANIFADYEVPRDLQEVIARDQLIYGERYQRLSDVPAIEMIVERMSQELSQEDLDDVRAGDYTALREEIKDPAIRAAVGSELRNEADVSDGNERHSEPVDQFQQLARQSAAIKVGEKDHSVTPDLSDDISL
ncbi:relaxase/mobilization nuclease domain-containing protein [uncultured Aliiroseovarius sp.]|uniref:relaxase/mobilization nuclease domain-containing protein n=1 Tax=uncultured Aliiroseovarius sp. TaxID=1658783 RepID=UPI00262E7A0A|nr:relaxase/mobilization nuclease domain-containing protein [uncultured Aliiroseovarius sp.]